ncbi:type I-E CRISPR-associated protein Cas5/CasD [Streptomyces sp. NPDC001219]
MPGLILHLSAPWQSWGAPTDHTVRPTHQYPTRSGLTGLIASALGRPRDFANTDLNQLTYTVRVDRAGHREMDFHTIGGGYPRAMTPATADGKRRKEGEGTLLTERWYLADAAFTVAATGPADVITLASEALAAPVYAPYLGRRSCPPDTPLLIRTTDNDPAAELHRMPLHANAPRGADTVTVKFIHETAPEPSAHPTATLRDIPGPGRTWTSRDIWETHVNLPASLCAGAGTDWINALTSYTR